MSFGAKPAMVPKKTCKHTTPGCVIKHAHINGEIRQRCTVCGMNWLNSNSIAWASDIASRKSKAPVPPHYLKRVPQGNGMYDWYCEEWGKLKLTSFYDAENLVKQWNAIAEANGKTQRYRLPTHCSQCYHTCSETFGPDGKCSKCLSEGVSIPMAKPSKLQEQILGVSIKTKPVIAIRTKGEIWKLDKSLSPMGTTQWGYMGSAKNPYIITRYTTKRDGSTTADGWACGCMDFTRRTPRTHCKHILNVMAGEGVVPANVAKGNVGTMKAMANVNDEQLEAFKKWQREQAEAAEKKPATENVINIPTGRKFK